MSKLKIGLLELGYLSGDNSMSILNDIIQCAVEADNLNFSRFWLAEHHNRDMRQPYTNPETLLTLIAGYTERIRVGSAGSLIGYYAPYLLASNYKLLNNLYENRIDFGLSKGRPSNSHKHPYFNTTDKSHINLFFDNLNAIHELYFDEVKNFEEKDIVIPPYGGEIPDLWYLSSSYADLDLALKKQFNYCRSLIHGLGRLNVDYNKDQLNKYKDDFYKLHNRIPDTSIALAISFTQTAKEIKEREAKAKNKAEAFTIIPVTIDSLYDLLMNYQNLYGIDEFILYDVERNGTQKIETVKSISAKFKL